MTELDTLKRAKTLPQLAEILGVKGETLSYAIYVYRRQKKYTYFNIPKKGGGLRAISAPNSRLKFIQSRLASLLDRIATELEMSRTIKSRVLSHGFKKDFSIITNASLHRNRRYVLNVDLKDFFPSINFGRVLGFFIKDKNFLLDPRIATIIAQIACFNNELPQGSPCSPVISNLLGHMLDIKLNQLANDERCTYSRYVDDLTFSTNEKEFPESIAFMEKDAWSPGNNLLSIIFKNGFKLNHKKTRMQMQNSRQDTTGLIVNKKLNVPHEYYKQARAMCHHLFQHGYCHANSKAGGAPIGDDALDGMMSFIFQIRKESSANFKIDQSGFSGLYTKFLDYRSFYGIVKPRIICEGKTDRIYIRSAIKNKHLLFPSLIEGSKINIDFFNYSVRTALFQELSGGGDELSKLLGTYRSRLKDFKHGVAHPVIMVVDNDGGSKGLFGHLGNILGIKIVVPASFYHVYENLYVVPIPKSNAAIEDLFEKHVLEEKINGREFNSSNKTFDLAKYYGKNELATKIVAPKWASIDFVGFEPLLNSFVDIIGHHASL